MLLLSLTASALAGAPWGDRLLAPVLLGTRGRVEEAAEALELDDEARARLLAASLTIRDGMREVGPFDPPAEYAADRAWLMARERALLEAALGTRYAEFIAWSDGAWERELARVASVREGRAAARREAALTGGLVAYEVFGTQYAAFTNDEVAIPDACIKFANLGWETCTAGYAAPQYYVRLDRGGYSREVWVGDVGPWNIDDNYWNAADHPDRPRRLFGDLPEGTPESEAAYYDGYNGGLDQYGREVLNPAAVDLHPDVAADLGLAYLENDWILVTFLWEPLPVEETEPETDPDPGTETEPDPGTDPEDTGAGEDTAGIGVDTAGDTGGPSGGPGGFGRPGGEPETPGRGGGVLGQQVPLSELKGCGCGASSAPAGWLGALGLLGLLAVARRR